MYEIDPLDSVVPFEGVPLPDAGAAGAVALASEYAVILGYRAAHAFNTTVVLTFGGAVAHYLGAPNDESIAKHPLSARGLEPYGVYVVQESSWARMIGQVSAVPHPVFAPRGRRHYLLTFQDCTFECVASEVEVETVPSTVRPAEAAIKKFRSLTRSA